MICAISLKSSIMRSKDKLIITIHADASKNYNGKLNDILKYVKEVRVESSPSTFVPEQFVSYTLTGFILKLEQDYLDVVLFLSISLR